MKKQILKTLAVLFAVVLLVSLITLTAAARTEKKQIELTTRSCLLVDRSGSVSDQKEVNDLLSGIDQKKFDYVGYFDDNQISTDSNYAGGGDSSICETIDEVIKDGYTHITLITDGQQWPADYSVLGVYTDIDLTIYLVGDKQGDAAKLTSEIQDRMVNSNLKVVKSDGTEETILSEYQDPVYTVEFDIPEAEEEQSQESLTTNIVDEHGKCYWWLALILGLLGAALFDFIHELITRRRGQNTGFIPKPTGAVGVPTGTSVAPPTVKPLPPKAIAQITKGSRVLADFSGSMELQQKETVEACKAAGADSIICFGKTVEEVNIDNIDNVNVGGLTHGWEAVEMAASAGYEDVLIVSDLGFNGKSFDKNGFSQKFKKITVVVPEGYSEQTVAELREIADEVEVLPL